MYYTGESNFEAQYATLHVDPPATPLKDNKQA